MLNRIGVLGIALVFSIVSGCTFLASKGVLTPGDVQALCADAAITCNVAVLVDANEDVKKACAAIGALCTGQDAPE